MTDEQRYKRARNKRDKDKYRNMTDEEKQKKKNVRENIEKI